MFDKIKDQAVKLAEEHEDEIEKFSDQAIQKAGDLADDKTGGKYSSQIDTAQEKADDAIGS